MIAPLRLHGYDFNVLWLLPAPHREAGGYSGAGAAELNAAERHGTDWEFTLMVLVTTSVFRFGMLLSMVQPIPLIIPSNIYHHPQTS